MRIIELSKQSCWDHLIKRPILDPSRLKESVATILADVSHRKDQALVDLTLKLDSVELKEFGYTEACLQQAKTNLPENFKSAVRVAAHNIREFHKQSTALLHQADPKKIETTKGITCWKQTVPITKVGLYIPSRLFSSLLMLGIPAMLAGCSEIVVCTPPDQQGRISDEVLFTADLIGITKIFQVGGAQAIAAMAYGTETVPQVSKIFGPGNQYVAAAKAILQATTTLAVDLPAGPTEQLVIADKSANPAFVAADLLSQAEHGPDSQVILVSDSQDLFAAVSIEIEIQQKTLATRETVSKSLGHSKFILTESLEEAMTFSNHYAPEHLILAVDDPEALASGVINAGSVFLGHYTPESIGDYASGPNHTLPTNRAALAYSGVSVASFEKTITYQQATATGLSALTQTVQILAEAEGLPAHANAARIRGRKDA